MKVNEKLGGILTTIGGLLGILGTMWLFTVWYIPAQMAESAEPGCELLLKYLMPGLGDVGIMAGIIYLLSAYGFFTHRAWAFKLAVVANVLALQGGFFLNVPFMAAGLPPVYFYIFFPNVVLYFLLTRLVGGVSWGRILLGLGTGIAFVLCLMNGIASWSRILTIGTPIFMLVQRLHWVAMIGWGIITVGILLRPMGWMRVLGIGAAVTELVMGVPLAYATTVQLARFSLFSLAPILSLILLVIFLWPSLWPRLTGSADES
jgi:hypothetical protein